MDLKLKNKTEVPQQIMKADNSGINVVPGEEVIISDGELFGEEIIRLGNFFFVEEVIPVVETKKYSKAVAEEKIDGGIE